jgi:hypothetical protein
MTEHHRCADHAWTEAMLADLQHQIDDLSTQLEALSTVVYAHTLRYLDPRSSGRAAPPQVGDDDG